MTKLWAREGGADFPTAELDKPRIIDPAKKLYWRRYFSNLAMEHRVEEAEFLYTQNLLQNKEKEL